MWRLYERGEVEVSGEKTVKQTEKVITEAERENIVQDEEKGQWKQIKTDESDDWNAEMKQEAEQNT